MKRFTPISLIFIIGSGLIIFGGFALAQNETEIPEFVGLRECRQCHRDHASAFNMTPHRNTLVEVEEGDEESPIVADFTAGEDLRTVALADGERAFTEADVAFTLGVGRNRQAYLYETEVEGQYQVLPAQWDSNAGEWISLDLGSWPSDDYAFGPNCASCHTVGLDVSTYEWEEDGVQCEACHGPGLDHVELVDDAGRDIDEEERAAIYSSIHIGLDGQTCGQCHSRGLSTDGIHPYPVGFYPGLVDDLTSVYDVFGPDNGDYWWPTGHASQPNMQYNEFVTSTHLNSLESAQGSEFFDAECLTCHSATTYLATARMNYEDVDPATVDALALIEDEPHGVTCASCHDPHNTELEAEDGEEAMRPPAGIRTENSYLLCTSCHSDPDVTDSVHYPVQQVFEGQDVIPNLPADIDLGVHFTAEGGPTCTSCHMPMVETYNGDRQSHTFNIIEPGDAMSVEMLQDSCSACHDEGPAALQQLIDDIQADTRARIETARAAVTDDTPAWVTTGLDVLDGDGSAGIHNYAYSDTLLDTIEAQLGLD